MTEGERIAEKWFVLSAEPRRMLAAQIDAEIATYKEALREAKEALKRCSGALEAYIIEYEGSDAAYNDSMLLDVSKTLAKITKLEGKV